MKRILALLATAATLSACTYESEDAYLRATLPSLLNCAAEADALEGITHPTPAEMANVVEKMLEVKHKLDAEGRDFYLWMALAADENPSMPEMCRDMVPTEPSPFLVDMTK
jgi:hypothetical protein